MLRQRQVLDLYLCCDVRSEGNEILRIVPADAYDPPPRVGQIVLTGEPLTGVLAYFLLGVSELLAAVGFNDDLEIRENDIPEIDVVFDWPGLVLWTGCFEGCWLLLVVLCPLARVLVG